MSSFNASAINPRYVGTLRRTFYALGVTLAVSTLSTQASAGCQYVVTNQWSNGFSATLKITNSGASAINGWDISWQYSGDNRITSSYNATLTGSNPYSARNLSWNGGIQPNQTVEFGIQGTKGSAAAQIPTINGTVCGTATTSSAAPVSSAAAVSSIAAVSSARSSVSSASNQGIAPLVVQGNKVTANGQPANLAGMSLFWSNTGWGGEKYYTAQTVAWLKSDWKANLVRVAMGVEEAGGYLTDSSNKTRAMTVIDAAIANNMYVIIDWHTHTAENNKAAAIAFFKEMATKYGNYNNVIYEVYNEPLQVSWSNVIKPYATDVIKEIRAIDPDNLIIVGTPTWSQDVDVASQDKITAYSNIAYTLHFYAGTHKQSLRDKAQTALNNGIALFVTEWGSVNADGNGGVDAAETATWLNFMKTNGISHANWALNDKAEGSSALVPNASANGGWTAAQLTTSGTLVRNNIISQNGNGVTSSSSSRSSVAPSSAALSSVSSSTPNGSGCNGNVLFCLDFEDVAPGSIPAGFTKEGTGIDVVQGQEARSGNRSVKFTSTNYANSGYFKKTSVSGKHWGRLYYKMKTPVPNINTWLHGTFVAARSGSAEFRFVDTVQEASGKYQYLYNVEPGDVALQGAYAYQFDNAWVCTEWYVDNQTQTYRFFRNGEELAFTRNGTTTNATNLSGFAPVPATLDWLGFGFRSYQQSSGVEGWLDDVAVGTERIGCNTASSSSVARSSVASSISSAASSVTVPVSSVASSSSSRSSSLASSSSSAPNSSSSSSSSVINAAAWTLDSTASYLNFVTTKNINTVEVHNFTSISGDISATGVASLVIDLNSVSTTVALRDERMRDLLFQTANFPTATVTLNLPSGLLSGLAVGDTSEIQITASLDLHGVVSPVATKVSVQRLSATRILVQNLSPVLVNAPDHALAAGVEALRAAVGIASISAAVPVDFTLIYDAR